LSLAEKEKKINATFVTKSSDLTELFKKIKKSLRKPKK